METQQLQWQFGADDSSYRTYEEWKQETERQRAIASFVLTVPMRNGNCKDDCGTEGLCLVLTVPMRNGNLVNNDKSKIPILFLPYL